MKKVLLGFLILILFYSSAMAIEMVRQKGMATYIFFPIVDADGDFVSSATGLDSEIDTWADGSAPNGFTDCTNEATEIGATGWYYLSLTASEMDIDYMAIQTKTTSAGAKTQAILIRTMVGDPLNLVSSTSGREIATNANGDVGLDFANYSGTITDALVDNAVQIDALTIEGVDATDAIDARVAASLTTYGAATATNVTSAQTAIVAQVDINETKIDVVNSYIDTEVAAIKAKTDNLPNDPADDSDIDGQLSTIDGIVDAIKIKTDNLPIDPAVDSDIDGQLSTIDWIVDNILSYTDGNGADGIDAAINTIDNYVEDILDTLKTYDATIHVVLQALLDTLQNRDDWPGVNVSQISGDTMAANNCEYFFDGTGITNDVDIKFRSLEIDNSDNGHAAYIHTSKDTYAGLVVSGTGSNGYGFRTYGTNGTFFEATNGDAFKLSRGGSGYDINLAGDAAIHGSIDDVTNEVTADAVKISGSSDAADNAESAFDGDSTTFARFTLSQLLVKAQDTDADAVRFQADGDGRGLFIYSPSAEGLSVYGTDGIKIQGTDDGVYIYASDKALEIRSTDYGVHVFTESAFGGTGVYIDGDAKDIHLDGDGKITGTIDAIGGAGCKTIADSVWYADTSEYGEQFGPDSTMGYMNVSGGYGGATSCPTVAEISDGIWGENDTTVIDTSQIGVWFQKNVGTEATASVDEGAIADAVWGENDTTVVDTSQIAAWLIANIGKEATATIDTAQIARSVWDDDVIAKASRTVTASCAGSGSDTLDIMVFDGDSTAVEGADLCIYNPTKSAKAIPSVTTDVNGYCQVFLDPASYPLWIQRLGVIQAEWDTVTVPSGGGRDTVWVVAQDAGSPPSANVTRIALYMRNFQYQQYGRVAVSFQIHEDNVWDTSQTPAVLVNREPVRVWMDTGHQVVDVISSLNLAKVVNNEVVEDSILYDVTVYKPGMVILRETGVLVPDSTGTVWLWDLLKP